MSDTPETDANCWKDGMNEWVASNLSRKLERERDQWKSKFVQANKDYGFELRDPCGTIWDHAKKLQQECDNLQDQRDEAWETVAEWENAAEHVKADHPDEAHCGCVKVLRKLLTDALRERDEAREAFAVATNQLVQAQEVLREIAAADWKTSGELRGMAKRPLEGEK